MRLRLRPLAAWALVAGLLAAAMALIGELRKPALERLALADGTVALFRSGTRVAPAAGCPSPHTIDVDGELLLEVPASANPLTLRSRLFALTIQGPAELHVTARSRDTGERVDVVSGEVTVRKNYSSAYSEPDRLGPGEMSMVNRTIDLLEKETFDRTEVAVWRREFHAP